MGLRIFPLPPPPTNREAAEVMSGEPQPAYTAFVPPETAWSAGATKWDKYRYKNMNSAGSSYHNTHLASQAPPEVLAFLKLYDVQVLAVTAGRMFVSKKFARTPALHGAYMKGDIVAANDGPLHAPLPFWQMLCQTLLDYAVDNGYKEPANEQEHRPE